MVIFGSSYDRGKVNTSIQLLQCRRLVSPHTPLLYPTPSHTLHCCTPPPHTHTLHCCTPPPHTHSTVVPPPPTHTHTHTILPLVCWYLVWIIMALLLGKILGPTCYQSRPSNRYTHTHTHTHTCTPTHTHTHTHTSTIFQLQLRVKNQCSKRTGNNVVKVSTVNPNLNGALICHFSALDHGIWT